MRPSFTHCASQPDVVNSQSNEPGRQWPCMPVVLTDSDASNKHGRSTAPKSSRPQQPQPHLAGDVLPESASASINSSVGLVNRRPKTGSRPTTDMYGPDEQRTSGSIHCGDVRRSSARCRSSGFGVGWGGDVAVIDVLDDRGGDTTCC